ncbi:hypothetical protein [Dactylosporangium sp. NPDC048998]|uniref:hypothetical protein n=1 Tax=Dactylosporangium sp. NPDC048998 TaxID=3363976 RepID=UPI0037196B33
MNLLIEDVRRNGPEGIGKPEQLLGIVQCRCRHDWPRSWASGQAVAVRPRVTGKPDPAPHDAG